MSLTLHEDPSTLCGCRRYKFTLKQCCTTLNIFILSALSQQYTGNILLLFYLFNGYGKHRNIKP